MFDPTKWFARGYQQVGDSEEQPIIEVDQISFTSTCSSDGEDNEGFVTARESNATLELPLEQGDLISFDTDVPGG